MDAGSLPGWPNVGRASPARRRPRGRACVADRRFPAFRLLSHCYFAWGPSATRAAVGGSAHDPRWQEEANVLETPRKSIGPSAHMRRREEKVSWFGVAAIVFRCCLQCGLWRIALATTAQS